MSVDAVVGLGANLGDRLASLRAAAAAIAALPAARVTAVSSVYETAPVGPPQPDYLNAAVRIRWTGSPRALLDALLAIERALGRVRDARWGPRIIDLDVLWIDGRAIDEPGLTVPHPRLAERDFALLPLEDVAPGARDPTSGASLPAGALSPHVRRTALTLDPDGRLTGKP